MLMPQLLNVTDDFKNSESDCRIALFPSFGLGDGLLFLIIANNLRRNGFKVTFYSDFIAQLQDWFPGIEVKAFPASLYELESSLPHYDLIISEGHSVIARSYPQSAYPILAKNYVFIGLSRFSQDLTNIENQSLLQKIKNKENRERLLQIAECGGTVLSRFKPKHSMVANVTAFCREMMKLKQVTKSNGLVPPADLTYQKYKNRVIIHPDSTNLAKNWLPTQFMKLAWYLKREGWFPAFTVSPEEYPKWESTVGKDFAMPFFNSLSDLASYIYESGIMIGNDSGIGHLASNLGIPTITIRSKRDPYYRWRPGWHINKVVIPLVSVKIAGKYYWRRSLPVRRVIAALKTLSMEIG